MTRRFAGPLERAKRVEGRQPAVVCGEHRLTHAELCERVQRLIGALRAMNLPDGSRVAVVGPNCHRYLELYLAVPAGGFVLVPLNARHTERELSYALEDSGASVLFATPDFRALEQVVDRFVELPDGYDSILAASDPGSWGSLREDDLAGLFYTGGTTGAAKGVMLTHGNLVANAYHFMSCWPFSPQTRWLVVAPMFHAAGTIGVLATLWTGCSHVILPAFDPGAVLDAVEREGVTATLVVPTMMAALVDEQEQRPRDVSSLRWLSHGSSPVGTDVLRRTAGAFPDASLLHIYGLTETAPILTLLPDEQLLLDSPQARSCGKPAIGIELQVVDQDARLPLPPGEVGEVRARGAKRDRWLLEQARGDRARTRRRLACDRGSRLPGRRRSRVPGRPRQGHDRLRRRERVLHRGRGGALLASRCARGRGVRDPRPALGRGCACGGRPSLADQRAGASAPLPPPRRRL